MTPGLADRDPRSDAGRRGSGAQCGGQAACLEQRRMDPLSEAPSLVQGLLHGPPDLFQTLRSRVRTVSNRLACELDVDGEGHEELLEAVVQVTLDASTVCIGGEDEPLARRTKLRDVTGEPVDRLLRRFDVRKLQGDRPPVRDQTDVLTIGRVPSSGAAPRSGGWQRRAHPPASTVVSRAVSS
jgi:hypothetical protein